MNHENISLHDLLDRQADVCKQINNCKILKKQIFKSKSIFELFKKAHKLVQNGLTPEQANNDIQQEIKKIQEDFLNIDLEQDRLYQKLNEINIAIINKEKVSLRLVSI